MKLVLRKLIHWLRFIRFLSITRSWVISGILTKHKVRMRKDEYDTVNNRIYLRQFGLSISPITHPFILRAQPLLKELHRSASAVIKIDDAENLTISVKGIKVIAKSYEEIFIIKEIFSDLIYNISVPESCILLDIGMNVAIASLFFSLNPQIHEIWAFEPFPKTFEQAKVNLQLNLDICTKIKPHLFGISDHDCSVVTTYSSEWKGSSGIQSFQATYEGATDIESVEIHLRDIVTIINKAKMEQPTKAIIVKMDCEGSEYEIIRRLVDTSLIHSIKAFMIEWHLAGPDVITKSLREAGFTVFSFGSSFHKDFGLIYAVA